MESAEPATAGRRSSGAPAEGQPRQRRYGP